MDKIADKRDKLGKNVGKAAEEKFRFSDIKRLRYEFWLMCIVCPFLYTSI